MRPLDPQNPLPLHAQISDLLQVRIARGELAPGDRLPTVRQLAVDLRVNSNTVARVYSDLERRGVLVTRRGAGTFVSEGIQASASPAAARERRLSALCREFAVRCSQEGFTLTEARRALRLLATPQEKKT